MLNRYILFHKTPAIDYCIKLALCLILLATAAPLVIEIKGDTPVTLQTLIILFCAIGFGWRTGVPAALLYVVAGVAGAPVFAGYRSGLDALTGPYGGFLFGFIAAAAVSGYLAETKAFSRPLPAILNWFLGHSIIILTGAAWLMKFHPDWSNRINAMLPGALIKSAAGALVIQIIIRFIQLRKKNNALSDADLPR